jgi:hypothetical protein
MVFATLLSVAVVGCAKHGVASDGGASDGAPFDGAPLDGPSCRPARLDGVPELLCPDRVLAGEPAYVRVAVWHSGCCNRGELRVTPVARDATTFELALEGTVCECCAGCTCLGPRLETTVRLDGLSVGVNRVVAGSSSCSIVVEDAAACHLVRLTDLRVPRMQLPGQAFAFVARGDSGSCGCTPRLVEERSGAFRAEACDCCEVCDCIDPPFEYGHAGPWPSGALRVNEETVELGASADGCGEPAGRTTSYEVVGPDPHAHRTGPALWMLHGTGASPSAECCGPRSAIEVTRTGPREFRASLRDCTPPCRCAGPPARLEAWAPLGELDPGRYTLRFPDGSSTVFLVPNSS